MKPTFSRRFLLLLIPLFLISCKHQADGQNPNAAAQEVPKGAFNPEPAIPMDSTAIDGFLKIHPDFAEFREDYKKFYETNGFRYVWYDKSGMIEFAHSLMGYLKNEDKDGLTTKIPYQEEFLELMNHSDRASSGPSNFETADIKTELMLTGQYFNYAKRSWGGETRDKVEGWYLPQKKLSYPELLEQNLKSSDFRVEEANAVIPQYLGLKKMLARYREIEKTYPESPVEPIGKKSLRVGDSLPQIAQLRTRLFVLGDLKTDSGSPVYDSVLVAAVNNFKERHGLKADGKISPETVAQANVPVHKRIEMLLVNMERFRWMPQSNHPDEFILVNIPEYRLHYFEKDKDTWGCNVVVGKSMHETVIFNGMMTYIVFSPYWNVPTSIVEKEIKPGIRKNPNYLHAHNMEAVNGRYRQKPGPKNSLGQVKFMFPNSNNIYLHDTPAKSLFNEDMRSFSHGCIRVAEPKALAERILKQDPAWTSEKITAAMNAGKEKTVVLKKKIPVYIGYFTAFVDSSGRVNFRDDIYKRDPAMLALLMK